MHERRHQEMSGHNVINPADYSGLGERSISTAKHNALYKSNVFSHESNSPKARPPPAQVCWQHHPFSHPFGVVGMAVSSLFSNALCGACPVISIQVYCIAHASQHRLETGTGHCQTLCEGRMCQRRSPTHFQDLLSPSLMLERFRC